MTEPFALSKCEKHKCHWTFCFECFFGWMLISVTFVTITCCCKTFCLKLFFFSSVFLLNRYISKKFTQRKSTFQELFALSGPKLSHDKNSVLLCFAKRLLTFFYNTLLVCLQFIDLVINACLKLLINVKLM